MDLQKLLKPQSVVVVGASEKVGLGGDTCRNILGYRKDLSRVYFVNPGRDNVLGRTCYHSVLDVPDDIDLMIVCTSQKTVLPLLREGKAKGVGGAVVYASGYSELGTDEGKSRETELVKAARELDIAVMGPNCGGYVNFTDGSYAFAFLTSLDREKGGIGFVSQSGQFCVDIMNCRDLKFSYAISAGNSQVVQMEDYLHFLIEDADTHVIALYLEGVKDPEKFEHCLRLAAERRKPIVVLKAGRSPMGQAVAASHTGSMTGSDKTFDAIFKKYGVVRVLDMQDLRSTAMLFETWRDLPSTAKFASMSFSGGETAICADTGYLFGIDYPGFAPATVSRLKDLLPFYASVRNPLDMTATPAYDANNFADVIEAVMQDPNVTMGILGWTTSEAELTTDGKIILEGIRIARERGSDKPLAIVSFMEYTRNAELVKQANVSGVPILPSTQYAFHALKHLIEFIEYSTDSRTLALAIPSSTHGEKTCNLSEYESKKLLLESGIPIDIGCIVKTCEEAVQKAEEYGYPIVLKIESNDILHKSDVGGVKLKLSSREEVVQAYQEIMDSVSRKAPDAKINGMLLQKMLPAGMELIVGVNSDPQFGPMILVGLGGVFAEAFKDAALYPAPLNHDEAMEMICSLKAFKLLNGYRGTPKCDISALADFLVKLSAFAADHRDTVKEMDINPLFLYPEGKGVAVADALIVLRQTPDLSRVLA